MDELKVENTDQVCSQNSKENIFMIYNPNSSRNKINMVLKEAVEFNYSYKKIPQSGI